MKKSVLFLFGVLFLIGVGSFASAAEQMTTVSRTTCVAPCAVFFDAVDTNTPEWNSGVVQPNDRDYASYFYQWDFGDPLSGNWNAGRQNSDGTYPSKNKAIGYIGAHVYENSGNYISKLNVTDTLGVVHEYEQVIEVLAEPSGGWENYYVSSSIGNDTYDGRCPIVQSGNCGPFQSFARGVTMVGTNRRILFKRGDIWNLSEGRIIDMPGPGMIGAYFNDDGTDEITQTKPILNAVENISIFIFNGATQTDWRITNLRLRGASTGSAISFWDPSSTPSRTLALNIDIDSINSGFMFPGGESAKGNENYFVGGVIENLGEVNNIGYAFFGDLYHSAIMGVVIRNTRTSHNVRIFHGGKTLLAHNSFIHPTPGLLNIKFHNLLNSVSGVSRYNIISDNYFSDGTVAYAPQGRDRDEWLGDAIIENNLFVKNSELFLYGNNITVRNNIFNLEGAGLYPMPIYIDQDYIPSSPNNIKILSNTIYRASATGGGLVGIWLLRSNRTKQGLTNITLLNNLAVWNYSIGNDVQGLVYPEGHDNVDFITSDYNIWYGPSGTFAWLWGPLVPQTLIQWQTLGKDLHGQFILPIFSNPNINSTTGDFRLQTTPTKSAGIDQGVQSVYVRDDFEGNLRDSMPDIGAYEFSPPTGNCVIKKAYWKLM